MNAEKGHFLRLQFYTKRLNDVGINGMFDAIKLYNPGCHGLLLSSHSNPRLLFVVNVCFRYTHTLILTYLHTFTDARKT